MAGKKAVWPPSSSSVKIKGVSQQPQECALAVDVHHTWAARCEDLQVAAG